nr:receptor-like protein kinase FERONIA [Ipomoea batatas]
MLGFALPLSFIIIIFHLLPLTAAAQPYKATESFLLSCGAPSKSSSQDGRDWDTDNHYLQFMPTNTANISFPATTEQGPLVSQVPFTTARVFTSDLTYSFRVSPGQKFLRLYFYPAHYSAATGGGGGGFNKTDFFFTVTANNYTLLRNFSAFLTVSSPDPFIFSPDSFIKKEFIVNVDEKRQLNLTFSPSPYAFVNGIEIVSMPSHLYFRDDNNNNYPIQFDNSTALETLYRLNVGSRHLGPKDDTGMFREWSVDDNYVVHPNYQTPVLAVPVYYTNQTPAYTAPDIVYTSARTMDKSNRNGLFWLFPVDAGFLYLFRFYFCEFALEIKAVNQRVFSIEINNEMVEDQVDVIVQSGGPEVPIMKDYVVFVPDPDGRRSKQNFSLSLRPNMKYKPEYFNAILNGLEIFKLNDSAGSLAVPNPNVDPEIPATPPPEKKGKKGLVAIIGGVAALLLVIIILIIFLIFRRRKRTANLAPSVTKSSWVTMVRAAMTTQKTGRSDGSRLPLELCRHFSLDELKLATGNFNENFVIGRGGFGKVYRGYIDGDVTSVAIKRLSPESRQGFREFQTEIKMLSKLRHLHLVAAVIPNLPRSKVSLAEWGRRSYETGDVGEIVDPNLKGQIAPECLIQYVEIACNCLKDQGIDRPSMNDVVWGLEFALQLQDATDKRCDLPSSRTPERPSFPLLAKGDDDGSSDEATDNTDEGDGDAITTSEDATKMFRNKSSVAATSTSTHDDSLRGQSHTIFSELSNQMGC